MKLYELASGDAFAIGLRRFRVSGSRSLASRRVEHYCSRMRLSRGEAGEIRIGWESVLTLTHMPCWLEIER